MQCKTELITPEIAAKYLSLNAGNRRLRPTNVKSLSEAMLRGEWVQTPEGISISSDHVLLDGQHRLSAVVMARMVVPMTVFHGVDPSVFSVINRGIPRSLSDITRIPVRQVEILNFFFSLMTVRNGKATAAQIMQINDVFGEDAAALMAYAPAMTRGFSQVGARAAVALLSKEGQRTRAFDMYRQLTLAEFSGLPPAVSALVKQVVGGRLTSSAGGGGQIESFAKVLFALDEKNAGKSSLTLSEGMVAKALARARAWIKDS